MTVLVEPTSTNTFAAGGWKSPTSLDTNLLFLGVASLRRITMSAAGADIVMSFSAMIAPASGGGEAWANTSIPVATPPGHPQSIELCAIGYEPEPMMRIASKLPMAAVAIAFRSAARDRR